MPSPAYYPILNPSIYFNYGLSAKWFSIQTLTIGSSSKWSYLLTEPIRDLRILFVRGVSTVLLNKLGISNCRTSLSYLSFL